MLIFSYRLLQLIIFPVILIIGLIRILNNIPCYIGNRNFGKLLDNKGLYHNFNIHSKINYCVMFYYKLYVQVVLFKNYFFLKKVSQ